jgi:hypothetical protein
MLLADPEGLGAKRTWLKGSPFSDYTIPGVVLLVLIGGGMLATALLAVRRHRLAATAAVSMAVALLGWGAVETAVMGFRGWPQVILLAVWVIGPAVALLAIEAFDPDMVATPTTEDRHEHHRPISSEEPDCRAVRRRRPSRA